MSDTDLELLRQFARDHSQDAFTALVRRHVDLVYSAALRQVRSPQLAEEVSQSVFTDLARNAARLKPDTILTAWLYQVARRTAVDVIRKESRRQLREQIATEVNAMNATATDWTHIEPLLDEAVSALDDTDRAAVLLRFFENKSLREVGQQLGVSDDAAQKRVSRAVERLREFFAKRGVTVGAGGLVAVISTNTVQAAPTGLAVTISTAALAGTAAATSTIAATATKAIAMTTLQKTFVTATVAVLAGAGIYEARQSSRLRDEVQALQQQQAPLAEQIQQLQQERDEATNRLADLFAENLRLKSNPNQAELLRLRGEVTRLRNDPRLVTPESSEEALLKAASKSWLIRVSQLKQYVQDHPNEAIPEFQFLNDRAWLVVADAGLKTERFETESDFDHAMQSLRFQAEDYFSHKVTEALRQFLAANNGKFPGNFSELASYCSPEVLETLRTLYEIKPASSIPEDERKRIPTKFDWFVTRKARVTANTTSRLAILANGNAYWQSRP